MTQKLAVLTRWWVVTKNIGKSGQFQEALPEETTISSTPAAGDLVITTTNPIVFSAGTGVTLSADGAEFGGSQRINQTISIQNVQHEFAYFVAAENGNNSTYPCINKRKIRYAL